MYSQLLSHLQSQTLLLDVRGCTAESVPCDGVKPAGLPSPSSPPNTGWWAAHGHCSTVTGVVTAMKWVARTVGPSWPHGYFQVPLRLWV